MSDSVDREERDIIERFERGELRSAVSAEREMEAAVEAARATLKRPGE